MSGRVDYSRARDVVLYARCSAQRAVFVPVDDDHQEEFSTQCIRAVDISSNENKALSGRLRQIEMGIEGTFEHALILDISGELGDRGELKRATRQRLHLQREHEACRRYVKTVQQSCNRRKYSNQGSAPQLRVP